MDGKQSSVTGSIGLLILRLGAGGYLLTHGWGKLQLLLDGGFDRFHDPIGLGPEASLVLITGAEFFCSLLVMAGLATRLAAVPVVIAMGVAALVVHAADPWTMGGGSPSKEPALLYLTLFLTLIFTGPGWLSLDALIASRLARRRAGAGAA
ncbi:MAG: DoxX family protein [Phycisphaeraceae bacterium]